MCDFSHPAHTGANTHRDLFTDLTADFDPLTRRSLPSFCSTNENQPAFTRRKKRREFFLPVWRVDEENALKSKAKQGDSSHNSVPIRQRLTGWAKASVGIAAPSIAALNHTKTHQPSNHPAKSRNSCAASLPEGFSKGPGRPGSVVSPLSNFRRRLTHQEAALSVSSG